MKGNNIINRALLIILLFLNIAGCSGLYSQHFIVPKPHDKWQQASLNELKSSIYNCDLFNVESTKTKIKEEKLFETLLFIPLLPVFDQNNEEYLVFTIKYTAEKSMCKTTDIALQTNNASISPLRELGDFNINGNLLCHYYFPASKTPTNEIESLSFKGISECDIPDLPLKAVTSYSYENRPQPW